MEQVKGSGRNYRLCFFAGVIMGILIGTCTITILISSRMDNYYKELAYLENTIADKNARLEKLESTINTKNIILEDINLVLLFEGDEIDKIEIEKTVRSKYSSLLGKEVKSIDADMVVEVVDRRILKLEEREYQLHVRKLILTEVLKIWIAVEQHG